MGAISVADDRAVVAFSSERARAALWIAALVLGIGAVVTWSLVWQKGSFLVPESDLFLVDHNDPARSFVSKIVCPHVHDAHLYQGRELSHVLEFLDAQFIDWCVGLGRPHFYSIVTYAILIALTFLHWHHATTRLGMDRVSCALLLGLFWTTPCIFFAGQYLRDAKQGAALLLFLLVWFLFRRLGQDSRTDTRRLFAVTFLLGLGLCFMDRQGFFLAGIAAVSLFALGVFPRRWPYLAAFGALALSIVVHTAYSRLVGPTVIAALNGWEVSFQYQKLPWDKFFMNPTGYLKQGGTLLVNHFRYFFGNLGGDANSPVLLVWCGMLALFSRAAGCPVSTDGKGRETAARTPHSLWRRLLSPEARWAGLFAFWISALLIMYSLMVLRHWVLVWPDSRTHYYWIPSTTLMLLAATFAMHSLNRVVSSRQRWVPNIVLALALVANLKSLPEHRRIQTTGHLEGYIQFAPHLLSDLASLPVATAPSNAAMRFDTGKSVLIDGDLSADNERQTIENPRVNTDLTPAEFSSSSHYYNFVRSRRNLPFRQ